MVQEGEWISGTETVYPDGTDPAEAGDCECPCVDHVANDQRGRVGIWQHALNAGMNAHLAKPLQMEKLMAALRRYCCK